MWDVIVVGAGPAGSQAASRCARSGLKTLLIEKKKMPRDKPCGGAVDEAFLDNVDANVRPLVETTTDRGRILLNLERVLDFSQVNLYFSRPVLDEFMARMAEGAGAVLLEGATVRSVRTGRNVEVVTDAGAFESRMVIGADGVNSTVRRMAGLECHRRRPDRMLAGSVEPEAGRELQDAVLSNGGGNRYFSSYFFTGFPGLGWVFPKRGRLNIGIGNIAGDAGILRPVMGKMLEALKLPGRLARQVRWHLIPFRPLRKIYARRVLLVGDAAGFVNPLTGAGLDLGVVSANEAACTASSACRTGDFSERMMSSYQASCAHLLRWLRFKARVVDVAGFFITRKLDSEVPDRFLIKRLVPVATA